MKGIVICSGGMDSVTLAYKYAQEDELFLVSFDYGQRHKKELEFAHQAALDLNAQWVQISLPLGQLLVGSALTDQSVDVPFGHYEEESMKLTVVPNRNMMMLSVAVAIAVAEKANYVATAIHAGDHAIYPDCRPDFIQHFDYTAKLATRGFSVDGFRVKAPFVFNSKAQIVEIGHLLEVPWRKTWSCYLGGEHHCGKCGTCVERKEAFQLAGVTDPTDYGPFGTD